MRFIKYHWFNILMVLLVILGMGLTLLIAFSPREDAKNRGFIPCTQQLAKRITNCQGGLWCVTKAVIKNNWCDSKVIGKGIKLWLQGKQPTPWSNYYFTPDLSHLEPEIGENTELFYKENPNYIADFEQVKQDYQKLEEMKNNDPKNDEQKSKDIETKEK